MVYTDRQQPVWLFMKEKPHRADLHCKQRERKCSSHDRRAEKAASLRNETGGLQLLGLSLSSMNDDLGEKLGKLQRTIADFENASQQASGWVQTIEYRAIRFNITRRFVVADMSPLTFFHLVEHIGSDGSAAAVLRLYERLMPLLTCNHEWTDLKRVTDRHMRSMAKDWLTGGSRPHVCRLCTAYAFDDPETTLPVTGRTRR